VINYILFETETLQMQSMITWVMVGN